MRILVVDDEEHLRRMMRLTLEASGYDVAEAADGEEGLRLFGDGQAFDATLLDQRMPGMDGLETLRRMKLQRANACIIMVTAYATIELAVDAMKLGATDFVRKPMTPDTLRHAVAAALMKRERPSAETSPGDRPSAPAVPSTARPRLPPVEIWTTNGFFVGRATRPTAPHDVQSSEHHFVVRRGKEGTGADVVVFIDPGVVARVARECKRPLRPTGAFWRQQAESVLVNYLWNEAELPAGRLVVSRVTAAMLDAAVDWSED